MEEKKEELREEIPEEKKNEEPRPPQVRIIIDFVNGQAVVTGNIPRSPVVALGLMEDAKIKIVGMFGDMEIREAQKKTIIKPNFFQGVRQMLSKK